MANVVEIRELVAGDALACAAIRREMLEDAPWAFSASAETDPGVDVEAVRERLAKAGHATVGAFLDGRLVGVAGMRREERVKMAHRALVWGVYVTPSARGRGLSRLIVGRLLEIARGWVGVRIVGLSCSEKAVAAKRVYESLGFVEWGREPLALVVGGEVRDEHHLAVVLDAGAG
jgi:RimJ/RimL family protein N-acetyltransferase